MKKMMSIAAVALMMAGSSAFACGSCGCADKGEKSKSSCSSSKECSSSKSAETKKSAATEEKGE